MERWHRVLTSDLQKKLAETNPVELVHPEALKEEIPAISTTDAEKSSLSTDPILEGHIESLKSASPSKTPFARHSALAEDFAKSLEKDWWI